MKMKTTDICLARNKFRIQFRRHRLRRAHILLRRRRVRRRRHLHFCLIIHNPKKNSTAIRY